MSDISKRGKDFELKVAKIVRMKIDKHARRDKGSHANWQRRSDVYTEIPIHLECKDQENLRPKEWFAQAKEASFGKTPVVAFQMEAEVMAIIKFDDLINLFVEIADQKLEIEDLRKPLILPDKLSKETLDVISKGMKTGKPIFMDGTLKRKISLCKNGHIVSEGRETCMTKGCPFSSTYIKPKAIKEKK